MNACVNFQAQASHFSILEFDVRTIFANPLSIFREIIIFIYII